MCLYIRELTGGESYKLSRWLKSSRNAVQMRRAQILSLSGQGMKARQIAVSLGMHEEYVRHLIRTFNEGGFGALKSRKRPGRREKLSEEERSIIVEIATAPPQAFGRPFNRWSLRKAAQ